MALIIVYVLSLILICIEPIKIAGIFLSVCYLPGLCFLSIGKRAAVKFEDLILAFPLSIGISSLLIFAALSAGVNAGNISNLIILISGAAVVFYVISRRKSKLWARVEIDRKEIAYSLFAVSFTALLTIPIYYVPDGTAASWHSFLHSSLVTNVLHGFFPPENPGLGGAGIGYYWGFHTLIAVLSHVKYFQPIQVMFAMNFISLFAIFCITYIFAKKFGLKERYIYIMSFALIGGLMRFDAGIYIIYKFLSGQLMPLKTIASSSMDRFDIFADWTSGIPWYDARMNFLHKYYNVSGMLPAVCLCLAYFLLLLLFLKRGTSDNKIYAAGTGIIIYACTYIYPPLAIVPFFHAPIWSLLIYFSCRGSMKEKAGEALFILLPYIIALLLVAPYLLYIMKAGSAGQGPALRLDLYHQSLKNVIAFSVLSPIILHGVWISRTNHAYSGEFIFLMVSTFICLLLSVFLRVSFDNSYKFNYVLNFFFAFYLVVVLEKWLPSVKNRWIKACATACIIFSLLLNPLTVIASYVLSSTEEQYILSSGHVIYTNDKRQNEAYEWIRNNTPPDALVMLGHLETKWPCCGVNINYETAVFAERSLYVIKDSDITMNSPEYERRVRFREKLFQNAEDPEVVNYFTALKRPLYLLLDGNLPDTVYKTQDRFKDFPEDPGVRFSMVFHNKRQRIYRINY
ncbi:MAG: hypothetical protein HY758_06735 [Nitrospirae bacterium]|nr:hypothetical protein [Nitrospirota bacterium]